MKKLLALLLTFVLMFSFVPVTAFAAGDNGSITINNINTETTYKVYKLFDLDSWSASGDSFNYQITDMIVVKDGEGSVTDVDTNPWFAFVKNEYNAKYFDFSESVKTTYTVDGVEKTVTTFAIKKKEAFDDAAAVGFGKDALKYAKEKEIEPIATNVAGDSHFAISSDGKSAVFSNLPWGYYLVDTSVGALCGLRTTKPNATISVKNEMPTVVKKVQEDSVATEGSTTNTWFDSNTADIGQVNLYDVTIYAKAGAENYVYHDKMENMKLYMGTQPINPGDNASQEEKDAYAEAMKEYDKYKPVVTYHKYGSSEEELKLNEQYEIITSPTHSDNEEVCNFEIKFSEDFCNSLGALDQIYITYTTKLTESAEIGGDGNKNIGWVSFGDGHKTAETTTTTYTYGFDLVKTDQNYNPLSGAEFKLYKEFNGIKTYIPLVLMADGETYRVYSEVLQNETEYVEGNILVNENANTTYGHNFTLSRVVGLDSGIYYVEEIKEPSGYNRLTTPVKIEIVDREIYATFSGNDNEYDDGSGINVINNAGSVMPETGGAGKTMFILFGTIAAIGTGVLLITKKRMSMFED